MNTKLSAIIDSLISRGVPKADILIDPDVVRETINEVREAIEDENKRDEAAYTKGDDES